MAERHSQTLLEDARVSSSFFTPRPSVTPEWSTWGPQSSGQPATTAAPPPATSLAPFSSFFMSFRSENPDSFQSVGSDFDPGAVRKGPATEEELALGRMSPIGGAVTMCCCQVGACLVAYASWLKSASPMIGICCFVIFGMLQMNSVSYLQAIWILTRHATPSNPNPSRIHPKPKTRHPVPQFSNPRPNPNVNLFSKEEAA